MEEAANGREALARMAQRASSLSQAIKLDMGLLLTALELDRHEYRSEGRSSGDKTHGWSGGATGVHALVDMPNTGRSKTIGEWDEYLDLTPCKSACRGFRVRRLSKLDTHAPKCLFSTNGQVCNKKELLTAFFYVGFQAVVCSPGLL